MAAAGSQEGRTSRRKEGRRKRKGKYKRETAGDAVNKDTHKWTAQKTKDQRMQWKEQKAPQQERGRSQREDQEDQEEIVMEWISEDSQ